MSRNVAMEGATFGWVLEVDKLEGCGRVCCGFYSVPLIFRIQFRIIIGLSVIKGWWFIMLIIHKNPIFESRKLFVIWIYLELNTNLNHQLTIG